MMLWTNKFGFLKSNNFQDIKIEMVASLPSPGFSLQNLSANLKCGFRKYEILRYLKCKLWFNQIRSGQRLIIA
jgi:hypothetical protein